MKKVTLDEILGLDRYEQVRQKFRQGIIEAKKARRVSVGDWVTFVFENHDTMLFQIQEMLRAERIADIDRVREEIEVYNALIPDASELSSTMLIEITEGDNIREQLVQLIGIDEAVRMEIADRHIVRGLFEAGHSKEDKLSAVQYVRFPMGRAAQEAFVDTAIPVRLVIEHPHYRAAARIEGAVRASLVRDLAVA